MNVTKADAPGANGRKRKATSPLGEGVPPLAFGILEPGKWDTNLRETANSAKKTGPIRLGSEETSDKGKEKLLANKISENISDDVEYSDDSENSDDAENSDGFFDSEDEDDQDDYPTEFEDGEKQYEVEEHQHTVQNPSSHKVTVKLAVLKEEEFEKWTHSIVASCQYNGEVVGTAFGRHILRNRIKHDFFRTMEEPSQDMSSLAFGVFNRYGDLKKEYKEHPVRKGTGVWGDELNNGSLFLIESVHVDADWRRNGLGRTMITKMIQKAQKYRRGVSFSLMIPGWLNSAVELELNGKSTQEKRAIRLQHGEIADLFSRCLGFRRIGASICFGHASDPTHASHAISAANDFDLKEEDLEEVEESDDEGYRSWAHAENLQEKRVKKWREQMPLHHAAMTLPGAKCVEFFMAKMLAGANEDEWSKVDRARNNILHAAACATNPKAVQWVMGNIDQDQKLSSARNLKGYTPLEALEDLLESTRISSEYGSMNLCISDSFQGFPPAAVSCLVALKGAAYLDPPRVLGLKYGCTCGACLGGFLSPRMRFTLHAHAEMMYDILADSWCIENDFWPEIDDDMTKHVPPAVRQRFNTNKGLRHGFAGVFRLIANCLHAGQIPYGVEVVGACRASHEWPPLTRNFFESGGTVESALRVVFEQGRDEDEKAGGGGFVEVFETDTTLLPECRNDSEFGFVALACGLEGISSCNRVEIS